MERDLMKELVAWKESKQRKPLLLDGARQVGKTWLVQEFGKRHFANFAYFSLENNTQVKALFDGDINPERIIAALGVHANTTITTDTLIIFDEIQEVPRALTALKYFCEDAPQYPVVATGSSLGITLHPGTSFPVGKVDFLHLYPLTFSEFLTACGHSRLADTLTSGDVKALADTHSLYMEWLRYYLYVGGMPEVVNAFTQDYPSVNFERVRSIQEMILASYRDDFSKYSKAAVSSLRIAQLWDSIPSQLAKENKKFLYGAVRSGGRGRDYEVAIQWLKDMSLIHIVTRVKTVFAPLKIYEESQHFKIYVGDVGLLGALTGLSPHSFLDENVPFGQFYGALAEQFVCQELKASGVNTLYYWSAENSSGEIDFVMERDGKVCLVEVKSGENLQSKSLKAALKREKNVQGYRLSALPYKHDGAIVDIPIYAASRLST